MRVGLLRARIRLPKLIGNLNTDDVVLITQRGRPIARLTHPKSEGIRPSRPPAERTVPPERLTMEYIKKGDEEVLELFGL